MSKSGGYCPLFGNYPREYNRAVHGPYYPWVNYGPKDTPLADVKLGELKSWIARRQKTPAAAIAVFGRGLANYRKLWIEPRYGSLTKPLFQVIVMLSTSSLLLSYNYYRNERQHKYHW